ncbi:MAG: branched-chain amino acid transport system substrate-binding protein, partial [Actinomycetota bacterium]|nr:branched-chain amino acid transport system substrate-binding protein [Actinomycetota bacterium]
MSPIQHLARSRYMIATLAAAIVLSACSVSSPRHGSAVRAGGSDVAASQGGSAARGAAGQPDQVSGPSGGSATGAPGAALPGGPATGGAASGAGSAKSGPSAGGSSGANQPAAGPTEVGVTKDAYTVSWSSPRSGYLAPIIASAEKNGLDVWVKEINSTGGINGRKVNIVKVDNQFTADGSITACKEITSNKSYMSVLYAGYASESSCLEKAGVPELNFLADQVDPAWKFQHYAQSVNIWGRNAASLIQTVLKRGKTKIGVIYLQDLAYGFNAKDAFLGRAKELGLNVVGVEGVNQNQASFVAQLQRLQAKGAETVVSFVILEIIGLLRDARSLGFSPTWTGAGY